MLYIVSGGRTIATAGWRFGESAVLLGVLLVYVIKLF